MILCSSRYALAEARTNLETETQRQQLEVLAQKLELFEAAPQRLPDDVRLPEKDAPILLAAIAARASHLITGDVRHFRPHLGKKIEGIVIVQPADYLKALNP